MSRLFGFGVAACLLAIGGSARPSSPTSPAENSFGGTQTAGRDAEKNMFMPFHPGAIRYYPEIGIRIPDALVPAN